jgi:DNA-binding NarL/FixJ family response regulator
VIKILVADDALLFRTTLAFLLSEDENFVVTGNVASGEAVLEHLDEHPDTDIVIMDIRINGLDGIETTKRIVEEDRKAKVIIFTMVDSDIILIQALAAGAKGFLTKDATQEELFAGIYAVSEGKTYLPSDRIDVLVRSVTRNPQLAHIIANEEESHEDFFTPKEKEILYLLTEGLTSREIADELGLSVRTVENHKFNMMTKAGVRNVLSLVEFAYKKGIITLREESKSPKDTNSGESVS